MARKRADIEDQLRRAVEESDMSLVQLAERSGVNKGILSRFLRRERSMTLGTAARLAEVLGLELRRKKSQERR